VPDVPKHRSDANSLVPNDQLSLPDAPSSRPTAALFQSAATDLPAAKPAHAPFQI
jgi:hypothetical protein